MTITELAKRKAFVVTSELRRQRGQTVRAP